MVAITLKNIPDDLYEQLKQSAALHHRSVNNEIIACLEYVLKSHRLSAEEAISQAQNLRQQVNGTPLTIAELIAAKQWGRP